ncbi:MAG TPA: leucyl/phenylalanyl-tRNA--protein transferase [Armatimonadota bacterium]|nr:leucyl/phenylalanyl-tRNA--protein transferase [Armatimonadota bacterium]
MKPSHSKGIISAETLLRGYRQGVFPMGDCETGRIGWYTGVVVGFRLRRGIIPLDEFHTPGRLRRELRKHPFDIRVDTAFSEVIARCQDRPDTWITKTIQRSYERLHEMGHAHSVEAWRDDELEGGLYGVAIGGAFFGESMFYRADNASKAALIALVDRLRSRGFALLDTQMLTPLTAQFGARYIEYEEYLIRLEKAIEMPCEF